ncbi:MAG: cryptochrome/photolyase family protein [Serpentinimonas sp.]|nr:cryptochrome/photolyase family protein [Serpentinimonas sp.]
MRKKSQLPQTAAPLPADAAPAHTLRLLLGDQLNPEHAWLAQVDAGVVYVLLELRQETDYVLHHAQKILAIFAAMRRFAQHLAEQGHRVRYVGIDAPIVVGGLAHSAAGTGTLPGSLGECLTWLCQQHQAQAFEYQEPDEWRLDQQLAAWCAASGLHTRMVCSGHFYTQRHAAAQIFAGRKQWRQETFYRRLRQEHGVLLDAQGQPEGGQWNFDADNRQPWRGQPPVPPDARPVHDHSALWQRICASGVQSMGEPDAAALRWPLDRAEALQQLDHFIEHRLAHFGAYQDALSSQHGTLFHSLLSFALNVKMLRPHEVVQRAEQAWRAGQVPLAAAEGFIRQILGWREYVRGVYWAQMPGYTNCNALAHQRPLPRWFWNGQTRMACMAAALQNSLRNAYAHHIQRLMVIGNFALLAGLDPQALHRWYLGIYIDAFEWVEAPNTLGMSQFADGGLLASKPYVSSAAYLQRMGDHCRTCPYDPALKTGARACPYNALYWDFFERHAQRLGQNARISLVYRNLQRMAPEARAALREQAAHTLERIEAL